MTIGDDHWGQSLFGKIGTRFAKGSLRASVGTVPDGLFHVFTVCFG